MYIVIFIKMKITREGILENMNIKILIILTLLISKQMIFCQNKPSMDSEYARVLEGLEYSHTLLLEYKEMARSDYFFLHEITQKEHQERLNKYFSAVKRFLELDKGVIEYLIKFNEQKDEISYLVKTPNGLVADGMTKAIFKKESGLILIDYFLIGKEQIIERPDYIEQLDYSKFKKFLLKYKNLNLDSLRSQYLEDFPFTKKERCNDIKACHKFEMHVRILGNPFLKDLYGIEQYEISRDFLIDITSIKTEKNNKSFHYGKYPITGKDFKNWQNWYLKNNSRLYFDDKLEIVIVRKRNH